MKNFASILLLALFLFCHQATYAQDKIYWIERGPKKIKRCNPDGSNVEDIVTGLSDPKDLALETTIGKIYWVDKTAKKIQRSNLDGTNIQDIVTGLNSPVAIDIDNTNNKVYWLDDSAKEIKRSNLDGTGIEDVVTELSAPIELSIDEGGGKVYWVDKSLKQLKRANIDGTNVEVLVTGIADPIDVEFNANDNKVYWMNRAVDKIRRCNPDACVAEDVITGILTPIAFVLDAVAGKIYRLADSKVKRSNFDGSNLETLVTALSDSQDLILSFSWLLPVELISFDAVADRRDVVLRWVTASETNNAGFEIQRLSQLDDQWDALGWIDGHGTTLEAQYYAYRVADLEPGRYVFHLKQIDYDGTFAFSPEVEVLIEMVTAFEVEPVYPNPFNPEALLRFAVSRTQHVRVELYDALGRRVRVLFAGEAASGRMHEVRIDGRNLPSGLYLVRVASATFAETRPVTLLK